ncbi:unnamed protein product, partial [Meganyctiphanes norvegica]
MLRYDVTFRRDVVTFRRGMLLERYADVVTFRRVVWCHKYVDVVTFRRDVVTFRRGMLERYADVVTFRRGMLLRYAVTFRRGMLVSDKCYYVVVWCHKYVDVVTFRRVVWCHKYVDVVTFRRAAVNLIEDKCCIHELVNSIDTGYLMMKKLDSQRYINTLSIRSEVMKHLGSKDLKIMERTHSNTSQRKLNMLLLRARLQNSPAFFILIRNENVFLNKKKSFVAKFDLHNTCYITFFWNTSILMLLLHLAINGYTQQQPTHALLSKTKRHNVLTFDLPTYMGKKFDTYQLQTPQVLHCSQGRCMGQGYPPSCRNKIYMRVPWKISGVLFQIIQNGDISVDSFFFLSGLLIAYGVLREMKKTGKLNIIMFYVHRIIRLTPPIAMCVWFYASVNRHLVSGPQAYGADKLAESCRKNGWRDITYLTNANWDNYERGGCMGQCWYTAVDTQLYLIAPLLIVPLHYFKDLGKAWLYIMTLTSLIIPGAIYNRSLSDTERLYVNETYMTPWCRSNSWIVGIWTGYIIFKTGNQLKLKKWQVVVGWTAAFATAWMVLLGMYNVKQGEATTTYIIYEASHRAAWAACLGWVAIACHNGYGGKVNGFLSHPVWQPVSRLTYGLYLISFEIQDDLVKYSRKNLFYYTPLNMIESICSVLLI